MNTQTITNIPAPPETATIINIFSERVSEVFSRLSRIKIQLSELTGRLDGSAFPEEGKQEKDDVPGELGTLEAHIRSVEEAITAIDPYITTLQKI